MSLTRSTRADAEAYAYGLEGRSRDALPVPWTNSPSMDDCAAFCSHVLWGGKPGPILWVDNFKSAGDGSYAAVPTDLAPFDVLLFDWEGNGVGNHVEFMVGDYGNGTVRTFGANGSDTRAVRFRTRPARYIMGRFRPAWATVAPPTHTPVGSIMHTILVTVPKGKGTQRWLANPETLSRSLIVSDAQAEFWKNQGVEDVGLQPASVLGNFRSIKSILR